jgi:lysyl-tRNA synthetase class 1
MFLDKGGKKISKSIGNVLSPQVWFKYATPESLILLMLKRSEGTREINVTDIPTYMDDFDRLEDVYFGLREEKNPRDLFNAKRLFEFVHLLKTPKKVSLHIPYNTMIEVAKILPEKDQVEFALEKLKEFGHVKKIDSSIRNEAEKRLEFAKNWNEDFLKIEVIEIKLSDAEKESIKKLIEVIGKGEDGEKLQYKIFEIAKSSGMKPIEFFKLIYKIILNSERGPRLGPYIIERGKKEVIEKLKEVI